MAEEARADSRRGTRPRSLIATNGSGAVGYVAIVWESRYAGFRNRGIPLVHQIAVGEPWRRRRVATLLIDAAERLAFDRGQRPLSKGMQVSMDHDLIIWLTKDLVSR